MLQNCGLFLKLVCVICAILVRFVVLLGLIWATKLQYIAKNSKHRKMCCAQNTCFWAMGFCQFFRQKLCSSQNFVSTFCVQKMHFDTLHRLTSKLCESVLIQQSYGKRIGRPQKNHRHCEPFLKVCVIYPILVRFVALLELIWATKMQHITKNSKNIKMCYAKNSERI